MRDSTVLSLQHAQQIIFRSFLYSQGHAGLQLHLLQHVVLAHPAWRPLDDEAVTALTTAVLEACSRFFSPGCWHSQTDAQEVEKQVVEYVMHLAAMLEEAPRPGHPLLLSQVMAEVLQRDCVFLVLGPGRPRQIPHPSLPQPSLSAPYFSHFVHYALLHRPTGLEEFDALFAEIGSAFAEQGETFRRCLAQPAMRWCMDRVLAAHNAHYPTQRIAVPPQVLLDEAEAREIPVDALNLFP